MSVINKMLRDLDQRHDAGADSTQAGPAALRQGTASIAFGDSAANQSFLARRSRMWLALLGLLVALALAAGGWFWFYTDGSASRPDVVAAPAAVAATPTTLSSSAPASAAVSAPVATVPAIAGPVAAVSEPATAIAVASHPATAAAENTSLAAMALRMELSLSARKALDALLSGAPPAAVPASSPPNNPVPSVTSAERPSPKARTTVATSAAPMAPAGDSAPAIQRQQQAGGDAMAQAQNLWSSGSREAAIDLMQQSIAAAERSAKAGTSASGGAVLVTLVREMTRMQLAEARFGAVWEMLTRLEPLLGNQPDLWAIRANAAQRLGRHQDSVHAYMMALQSRPDEQRWLLGTAVSLAALGQTSSAAEMAEKARTAGPVSKDVLAYLRQAGVPLKD